VVNVRVGELLASPMVIVPLALIPLPPDPELELVTSPPEILTFPSAFRQTALYESVTAVEFLNVAPAPEVVTFTVPEVMLIFPVAEIPFPPAPEDTIVILLPLISISVSALMPLL